MGFEPRRFLLRLAHAHALRLALVLGVSMVASACGKTEPAPTSTAVDGSVSIDATVDVVPSGDAVPSGPTVPLADGGVLAVPAQCQPDAAVMGAQTLALPYKAVFHFRNQGTQPVWYRGDCAVEFAVGSCAAGFADDLTRLGTSGCACEFRGSCPVGGPCLEVSHAIAPAAEEIIEWPAIAQVRGTTDNGVECSRPVFLPAGSYEVRLALYANLAAARAQETPVRTVRQSFILPSADPHVDVSITP